VPVEEIPHAWRMGAVRGGDTPFMSMALQWKAGSAGNVGLYRENGGDRRFAMPDGGDAAIGGNVAL